MPTYIDPIFCGDMGGKLTQYANPTGTTYVDLTTVDPNGPIRIDSLAVTVDDVVQAVLALRATDGTLTTSMTNVLLARPIRVSTTNGTVTFTFAATSITRSPGSWLADGFMVGDYPVITGAPDPANNLTGILPITALTDTVMTLGRASMTARAACLGACMVAAPDVEQVTYKNPVTNTAVTFAFAATTITRSAGSWITDGYAVGQYPVVTGSPDAGTNNSMIGVLPITTLTDTVMTIAGATMAVRAAYMDGSTTVSVPTPLLFTLNPGVTNVLAVSNMSAFRGEDAAGNKFIELPKGWKLQGALISQPTTGKLINVQARWGAYASA